QLGTDALERHRALLTGAPGLPDVGHSAAPEPAQEPVFPDRRTRRLRHARPRRVAKARGAPARRCNAPYAARACKLAMGAEPREMGLCEGAERPRPVAARDERREPPPHPAGRQSAARRGLWFAPALATTQRMRLVRLLALLGSLLATGPIHASPGTHREAARRFEAA